MNESRIRQYKEAEHRLWQHYGVQTKTYFLSLARPRVRIRVQEIGEGAPVLFVHGGPNAGTTWAPLVARMQKLRCQVLDRPGCGLSDAVDYGASDLRALATDVLESVLDALEMSATGEPHGPDGVSGAYRGNEASDFHVAVGSTLA